MRAAKRRALQRRGWRTLSVPAGELSGDDARVEALLRQLLSRRQEGP